MLVTPSPLEDFSRELPFTLAASIGFSSGADLVFFFCFFYIAFAVVRCRVWSIHFDAITAPCLNTINLLAKAFSMALNGVVFSLFWYFKCYPLELCMLPSISNSWERLKTTVVDTLIVICFIHSWSFLTSLKLLPLSWSNNLLVDSCCLQHKFPLTLYSISSLWVELEKKLACSLGESFYTFIIF